MTPARPGRRARTTRRRPRAAPTAIAAAAHEPVRGGPRVRRADACDRGPAVDRRRRVTADAAVTPRGSRAPRSCSRSWCSGSSPCGRAPRRPVRRRAAGPAGPPAAATDADLAPLRAAAALAACPAATGGPAAGPWPAWRCPAWAPRHRRPRRGARRASRAAQRLGVVVRAVPRRAARPRPSTRPGPARSRARGGRPPTTRGRRWRCSRAAGALPSVADPDGRLRARWRCRPACRSATSCAPTAARPWSTRPRPSPRPTRWRRPSSGWDDRPGGVAAARAGAAVDATAARRAARGGRGDPEPARDPAARRRPPRRRPHAVRRDRRRPGRAARRAGQHPAIPRGAGRVPRRRHGLGDSGAVATALREAEEETGLDPSGVVPLAVLPELYLPPSGFVVTPVLAHWARPSRGARGRPGETATVVRVPLAELADPANRLRVGHPVRLHRAARSSSSGLLVWGFTGGILSALLDRGGWARPWDTSRVLDLDEAWAAARARPAGGRGAVSWVDLVVVALALLAAISGWRHGMAVALLSFIGVLGGAIIGVRWPRCWPQGISNTNTRVIVSVAVVVMLVVLGETTRRVPRPPRARPHHRRAHLASTRRSARSCRRSRWSWPRGWSRCRWPRRACPASRRGCAGRRCSARSTR